MGRKRPADLVAFWVERPRVSAMAQPSRSAAAAQSLSRAGQCWDNVVSESWFSTLKEELIYRQAWPTRIHARRAIFEFIEVFYNRERLHSSLGDLTPVEYERRWKDQNHTVSVKAGQAHMSPSPPYANQDEELFKGGFVRYWGHCRHEGSFRVTHQRSMLDRHPFEHDSTNALRLYSGPLLLLAHRGSERDGMPRYLPKAPRAPTSRAP